MTFNHSNLKEKWVLNLLTLRTLMLTTVDILSFCKHLYNQLLKVKYAFILDKRIYVENKISQITQIFSHLKLWIAVARHNFKWRHDGISSPWICKGVSAKWQIHPFLSKEFNLFGAFSVKNVLYFLCNMRCISESFFVIVTLDTLQWSIVFSPSWDVNY